MITVRVNQNKFVSDMNNIIQYSLGFIEGVHKGKSIFLNNIGMLTRELLEQFIDSNARSNPQMLHHVYEWYRTGSPDARLFDINYTVSNIGLSFYSDFKQSTSVKKGSRVPFYNKANIIENGIPVTIRPVRAQALVFEDDGETIFTRQPVEVANPGGTQAQGGFEKTLNLFFTKYFTQAFLKSSGIKDHFKNPTIYKKNLANGKARGKTAGVSTGYAWITKAGYKV
jgi:hypothetical protein